MSQNYIPRLYDFLRRVAVNNNREWFHANKTEYDELRAAWLEDIERLIALMTSWEPSLASQNARSAAYRFYRDTRFSQDKSPYKTYFSAAFSPFGRSTHRACYYLDMGIRPEAGFYGGLWCPDSAMLRKLRAAIVDNIEEFEEILADKELSRYYPGWIGETLKTVPKGWERNHPQAHLLRLKDYGKYSPADERFFAAPDWVERASERFQILRPLIDFFNYSLDEE